MHYNTVCQYICTDVKIQIHIGVDCRRSTFMVLVDLSMLPQKLEMCNIIHVCIQLLWQVIICCLSDKIWKIVTFQSNTNNINVKFIWFFFVYIIYVFYFIRPSKRYFAYFSWFCFISSYFLWNCVRKRKDKGTPLMQDVWKYFISQVWFV